MPNGSKQKAEQFARLRLLMVSGIEADKSASMLSLKLSREHSSKRLTQKPVSRRAKCSTQEGGLIINSRKLMLTAELNRNVLVSLIGFVHVQSSTSTESKI
jgi:hypothetical protein